MGEPAKKPRARHKPDDDYEPIICKKCGEEIYHEVQVVVRCPLGWSSLSKEGMRSKKVKIKGTYFDDTRWICGCKIGRPSRSHQKITAERHLHRPGKRWYKNMVPKPKSEKAKNPHPAKPRKRQPKQWKPPEQ